MLGLSTGSVQPADHVHREPVRPAARTGNDRSVVIDRVTVANGVLKQRLLDILWAISEVKSADPPTSLVLDV